MFLSNSQEILIMNKYIVAITAVCTLFFSACTKQLDIQQKGVVAYETYYTSDEAAEAALVNVYARLVQSVYGSIGNWNPYFFMMNYSADDVFAAGKNKDDHLDVRLFNEYRYDATYDIINRVYTSLYHTIYACNLVIDNFTKEGAYSSPVVDRCVAEARVVRAWCHMTAALTWQRPPLVDHCLTDEDPTNVESQKFLLDWCIKECETAIPNLRERQSTADKDATTYVTKGFAQFVAGKSAVFAGEMDVARKHLGDLINSGKYALVPGDRWWENFHTPGDGNEEKIFEPNWVYDANNSSGDNRSRAKWNQNNTLNWRGKNMNSWPVCQATTGWNGGAINGYFAEKFLAHDGNGPRRMGTFFTPDEWLYGIDSDGKEIFDKFPWMRWDTDYVGNNHTSGELKPASEWTLADKKKDPKRGMNANGFFGRTYYMNWKFMSLNGIDVVPEVSDGASNQSNSKCARYAEALLLYAEACIGSGDAAKGKEALNLIQRRAEVPETELTLANVQEEKQYELWFESCRFHDIVRWGIADQVCGKDLDRYPQAYDAMSKDKEPEHRWYYIETKPYDGIPHQFIKGKHEYFPFPADVCSINPALHQLNGWATETE